MPLKEGVLAEPVNISEVAFRALQTGFCSYYDLATRVGLESALNMIEASQVAQYNKEKIRYFSEQQ